MESNEKPIPMDKLARVYRKMQSRIQELTAAYESEVEVLKAQQEQVKMALKDQMLALGLRSVNTTEGTVILSERTRYHAKDWDAFKQFVIEHDAVDLLEKRIAQTNMATFLKENPNIHPECVNSFTEFGISVRKPSSK
jgi:hypothetical protein